MNKNEIEDLYLKSLDQSLTDHEKKMLEEAMSADSSLKQLFAGYDRIREVSKRTEEASFGPYFAQKIVARIQNMREDVDQQVIFFFKKFRVAALGLMIALVTINVIFSDEISLTSIMGSEEQVAEDTNNTDEEIEGFDFLETLANN